MFFKYKYTAKEVMCENTPICEVCGQQASQRCSECSVVYYCGREHQRAHWKLHKKICRPYKISKDEALGRYLEASRAIKAGEIIVKEKPFIRGPAQMTGPVCLGCLEGINEETSVPCTKCGWPVCDLQCENSPEHKLECEFTALYRGKVSIRDWLSPHPLYRLISPLRVLLAGYKSHLVDLESHCAARKRTDRWLEDELNVVQALARFYPGHPFTESDIMRACGILQINAHEVPLTTPPHVALFANAGSIFEHRCIANCSKTFRVSSRGDSTTDELVVWAAMDVNPGEHLTICYTDPLWGTENRQHHLQESKFFHCTCERCEDPTELGSYTSAVLCRKCGGPVVPSETIKRSQSKPYEMQEKESGNIHNNSTKPDQKCRTTLKSTGIGNDIIRSNNTDARIIEHSESSELYEKIIMNKDSDEMISEDIKSNKNIEAVSTNASENSELVNSIEKLDISEKSHWICKSCGEEFSNDVIRSLSNDVNEALRTMERGSVEVCKRFLNHYGNILPMSHYAMVDIQIALAHLLGAANMSDNAADSNRTEQLRRLEIDDLEFKLELCERLSTRLKTLAPAECRLRGSIEFERHAALAELARRCSGMEREQYLRGSLAAARICQGLLKEEQECTGDGFMRIQAEKNAKSIESVLVALQKGNRKSQGKAL